MTLLFAQKHIFNVASDKNQISGLFKVTNKLQENERPKSHCVTNFATIVFKIFPLFLISWYLVCHKFGSVIENTQLAQVLVFVFLIFLSFMKAALHFGCISRCLTNIDSLINA